MSRLLPVAVLSVLLCSTALSVQAQEMKIDGTRLDISAHAEAKAKPDVATFSAGVITESLTAKKAMQENAQRMTRVFAALKAAGVKAEDIQTSGLNLNAQYVYQENLPPKIRGYQASNNVSIRLHDLEKSGDVLDVLVSEGANQLSGPSFTIDDPEKMLDETRKEAMAKARNRAELYASAAGLKIKRIVSISENVSGGERPPMPMMAMAKMESAMDASTPVASGQVSYTANVNVTYELE